MSFQIYCIFVSKNTLQEALPGLQEYPREAYFSPGTGSRKLFLDSRNTLVKLIPFQEHSPGSSSWTPGIPKIFGFGSIFDAISDSIFGSIFTNASSRTMVLPICSKHSCEKQPESLEKHECFEQNDGFANLLEAFV